MSDYRRWYVPGGTYFLTVVTYDRRPILTTDDGRKLLRAAIKLVTSIHQFRLFATVLLPDHWHLVMMLPSGDANFSMRLKRIKEQFTQDWIRRGLPEAQVSDSQQKRGERGIWQPRFWEHTITDAEDLERCVDYIHWNPRKHGLVSRVTDWPWSSFHRFVKLGYCTDEWGGEEPAACSIDRDWGE